MDTSVSGIKHPNQKLEDCFTIPSESPFRSPPVIREVVRSASEKLKSEIHLLRKDVAATAPCFAIRTQKFDDASLMCDALPFEVWELIFGRLTTEDILTLFGTCKTMQACFEKYSSEAEEQYQLSAAKIAQITSNPSFECFEKDLAILWNQQNFFVIPLCKIERKKRILSELTQNDSIKLLRIEAKNISKNIDGTDLGPSFQHLSGARIELDLSDNNYWSNSILKNVFISILKSDSVSLLNLDRNNFRDTERAELFFSTIFSPNFRVTDLSISGSQHLSVLTDYGMSLLAYGLMVNQPGTVKTINLSNTSIRTGSAPYPDSAHIFVIPSRDWGLHLWGFHEFSYNTLRKKKISGLQLIIEAFETNTTVTAINLSGCEIDDKLAKVIAGSLQKNRTLLKLYLGNNLIKNEGIKTLAKAIGQHPSLQALNLAFNKGIEQKGWTNFFASLSGNTSLLYINLNSCAIGDKGATAVEAMLKVNRTLKQLILANNRITDEGVLALVNSLKGHLSISLLDLTGNCSDDV